MWFVKSRRAQSTDDYETWIPNGVTPTLNALNALQPSPQSHHAQMFIAEVPDEQPPIHSFDTQFGSNANVFENISPTLKATQTAPSISESVVRRLTPTECERLMGWPDNHTLHRADGKTNSDSTRYKMCGNGVATPVAYWIATQLKELL